MRHRRVFGMSNFDNCLSVRHVENIVSDLQDADTDKAFCVGLWDFFDLVEEARKHAPVVDAGESVLVREPFQNFFNIVCPCYLDALSSG